MGNLLHVACFSSLADRGQYYHSECAWFILDKHILLSQTGLIYRYFLGGTNLHLGIRFFSTHTSSFWEAFKFYFQSFQNNRHNKEQNIGTEQDIAYDEGECTCRRFQCWQWLCSTHDLSIASLRIKQDARRTYLHSNNHLFAVNVTFSRDTNIKPFFIS